VLNNIRSEGRAIAPSPVKHVPRNPALKQQAAISILDQAFVSGTRFLTTVFVAHTLGAASLGYFAVVFGLVLSASVFQQSLVMTPLTNFIHRVPSRIRKSYAGGAFLLSFILIWPMAGVFLFIGTMLGRFGGAALSQAVFAAVFAIPGIYLVEFARRYCYAINRPGTTLRLGIAVSATTLGGFVLLVTIDRVSVVNIFYVIAVTTSLCGGGWLALFGRRSLAFAHTRAVSKRLLRFGRWVCASEVALVLRSQSSIWLIQALCGAASAGTFAACVSLMRATNPFLLGIANVTEPKLASSFAKRGLQHVGEVAYRLALALAILLGPLCLLLAIASPWLLYWIFGAEFASSWPVAVVLCFATFIGALSYPLGNTFQAIHRPQLAFKIRLAGTVFALLATLLLTWFFGIIGAALAVALASVFSLCLRVFVFANVFRRSSIDEFKQETQA